MKLNPFRTLTLVLFCSFFLLTPQSVHATAIANSDLSFFNIQITPDNGTVELFWDWELEAFAEAKNSLGELDQDHNFSFFGGTVAADAMVTWADGHGDASAPTFFPPDLSVTGNAASNVYCPGCDPKAASSLGRGGLWNDFVITGGTGTVDVDFYVDLAGSLFVFTDECGVFAETEVIFGLELDGNPILFHHDRIAVGPNSSDSLSVSEALFTTVPLKFDVPYFLYLEVDSESAGAVVPEPATLTLTLTGLGFLAGFAGRRRQRKEKKEMGRKTGLLSVIFLLVGLTLFLLTSPGLVEAKYKGSDPPCGKCDDRCKYVPGGSAIGIAEGNLQEQYDVTSIKTAAGPAIDFSLSYNSYNADNSRAQIDTVMGYGWTHSYNVFLFRQRGHMFLMDGDGRIIKYKRGAGGIYTAATGYFETLVRNLDGTFTLTQKDKTVLHFALIPDTPFMVGGPVYRLTSIVDRNSNTTSLNYTTGNLTTITDSCGRTLTLGYNGQKKLVSIKDPLNRTTTLEYDLTGRKLLKITDPEGKSIQYSYNFMYQLTQKADKDGRIFSYVYQNLKPVAIKDGAGNTIFSLTNPTNWATDRTALARNLMREYIPATTSKTDGRGNLWKYDYNEHGYMTKVVAPDGCTTTYTYDSATLNVATETDANGNTASYEYDVMGNQTKVTDALGNETVYTYDPTYNLVTSVTDPDGDVTTYDYDAHGNLIKETDPLGNETTSTYDPHGNLLTVTDCNGNTITYEYDTCGNRIKEIDALACETTYTYDAVGNMLSKTDGNGHTITYEYDLLDRLKKEIDPKGCIITYTYDGEGNRLTVTDAKGTTSYEYDLQGRLAKVTDAKGGVTAYTYDGNNNKIAETNARGFTTTYEYDSQNRLIKIIDAKLCVTTTTYDCAGNKISETDSNDHTITFEYDELNRLVKTTDALGYITTYTYNGAGAGGCPGCGGPTGGSSLIASVTDANGKVTCYKYDKLDRQIKVIRKVGDTDCGVIDADDVVTEYTYDCVGNRLTETDPNGNTTTYSYNVRYEVVQECNPEGECTQYTYDCVGNKLTETRHNGNVITYAYDEKDQLVSISDSMGKVASYTYDCIGNRITEQDGNNNSTQYEYDPLNRLIKVTDSMGQFTIYEYDAAGNLIKVTDREGNQTSYTYDEVNRRITITDALGGVTTYEYDCVGNLIKIIDCNGNATTYEYDPLNRLIKETYADGGIKEFTYDCVGNLMTRKDQKGIVTNYEYDVLYRLAKRDYPGMNDDVFTYDKAGRMLTADNLHSAITFIYDGANRVTQTTQNGLAVNYTFDIANNKRIITYPGGKIVKEEMDKRDRLKTIKDAIDKIIAGNTYDPGNRLSARTFLNTTDTGWNYNPNNWTTQLTHKKGATFLIDFGYDYDKEGNRLYAKKNHDTSNSEKYTYDALYRLIEFKRGILAGNDIPSPGKECTWTLDCVGNWLEGPLTCPQSGGCSITHNQVNEYTDICGVAQSHDDNGNLVDDNANTYEYDYENRLIKVIRKSDNVVLGEYRYDALSRRVKKETSGVVTSFVYDSARVIEERQGGSVVAEYVYGGWIDEVITMDRGGSTYYYHTNALGSIVALTDSAGNILEHYRYDAYGKPEIFVGPGVDGIWFTGDDVAADYSSVENPYLFTGRRLDDETELYYYRARYYDSERGRFLQRDPLGYVDGFNLYEYAKGSPTNWVDAYGEENGKGEKKKKNCCCCCVDSLKWVSWNKRSVNRPAGGKWAFGHDIITEAGLSYKVTKISSDCQLIWEEKTNLPYVAGMPANTWTDMTKVPGTAGSFGSWTGRGRPCPGKETWRDTDPAQLGNDVPAAVTRTLEFRVTIKSSCTKKMCMHNKLTITAKQELTRDANWKPTTWKFTP